MDTYITVQFDCSKNVNFHKVNISKLSNYEDIFDGDIISSRFIHLFMIEYSKKYPDIVFSTIGELVDYDEIFKRYYKNGKSQFAEAKIYFEPFDEKLLR